MDGGNSREKKFNRNIQLEYNNYDRLIGALAPDNRYDFKL